MAFIEGRDVSSWNEDVPDFTASDFAVVKATEGSTYYNPKHSSQVENARRLEIVVGHYHFVNEHSPIPDQVAWFLSKVPDDPDEFLALDWEVEAVSDGAKDEFLRAVMAARPHQRVLLYCNASFWARSSKFAGDGLWIAEWDRPKGEPNSKPWIIHQYTSNPYDKNVAAFESLEAFADWVEGKAPQRVTHVVTAGDTVEHILDFYNITLAQLEEWNPQLLTVGKALLVSDDIVVPPPPEEPPPPPPPADPYANGLPVVGRDNPSAKPLQLELKRVGYLAASVPLADNYGPKTQEAVKRFYTANADQGFVPGIIIGPKGWAHLRTEATGSYPPADPPPPPNDGEPAHDYTRVTWSGKVVNRRTVAMLNEADRLLTAYDWTPVVTQGSYNAGGVSASAGTHDGGGVIDIRSSTMTVNGAWQCVQALRKAGFAAWYRVPSEGPWVAHIHAVAIGDREMSQAAKNQVRAYFNGRNGLANNAPDSAPSWVGRPFPAWAAKYK